MKTSIKEFFKQGAVVATVSGIDFGVAKQHLEVLAANLPKIAAGELEAESTFDVEYVDGRVNQMAIMFGAQEVLKGTAKAYSLGGLPSFEDSNVIEDVYLIIVDGSHISFTVKSEDGKLYNAGCLNSFVVPEEDFADFASLIEGVDFDSYPSQGE